MAADALITPDGVVGVSIGAPWKEIAANFNQKGRYAEVAAGDGCDVYQRLDGQIDVMVEDGIVTRIETADPRFRTPEGFGVGTTLKELTSAFGAKLIKQENPYSFSESDLDAEYIVWSGKGRGINFYLRGGAVSYLIVGGSSIEYVEGCL